MSLLESTGLFLAAAAAGAINSVAGGGSLLTFPALLAAGELSTIANATSCVAVYPGQVSSLYGLREDTKQALAGQVRPALILLAIALVGGTLGAWLLTFTSPGLFSLIVPWLILFAVALFLIQDPLSKALQRIRGGDADPNHADALRLNVPVGLFLFLIALYGGYFGAGIGIMTIAAFSFVGMRDIHRINGTKAFFTLGINGAAVVLFVIKKMVVWDVAALMAVGSLVGGYGGVGIAKKIGQANVRRLVVLVGVLSAGKLFYDQIVHRT